MAKMIMIFSKQDNNIPYIYPTIKTIFIVKKKGIIFFYYRCRRKILLFKQSFEFSVVLDTIRCFSCMSPIYEAAWSELQHVYYAPRNFTKLCDSEHIGAYSVRSVACQTVCIRMTEILVIGGEIVLTIF